MFASSEFVALCQTQIALLTQGLGATLSVVYLAEEVAGESASSLVPIAAHPEAVFARDPETIFSLLSLDVSDGLQPFRSAARSQAASSPPRFILPEATVGGDRPPEAEGSFTLGMSLPATQRMMLPLVHETVVLGVLVTARADRPWADLERAQIERIARTLAIACVLDRRAAWTDHNLHQMEQLQAQQHELLDNLLHQFRNPLTALRTFGKLFLRRLAPSNRNRDLAESIVRESEHLQELLNQFEQVMDLQPVEWLATVDAPGDSPLPVGSSPRLASQAEGLPLLPSANVLTSSQLEIEPCFAQVVLKPLVNSAQAIAQDRHIQFQAIIPDGLSPLLADMQALRESLNNLLDNALKYTPSGGMVEVLAGLRRQRGGQRLQGIAVIDNGPGIPSADRDRLFERHFRGIQASSEIPGTGLGLAITRDLIQRMNGDIEVLSPVGASGLLPPGETGDHGTAFIVWLPEVL